jgi:hypothetical protein
MSSTWPLSTRKYYSSIWHLWGKDAVGEMANPWESRVPESCESRILSLRATLYEIRRLIEADTEKSEICQRITNELEHSEWSVVNGLR